MRLADRGLPVEPPGAALDVVPRLDVAEDHGAAAAGGAEPVRGPPTPTPNPPRLPTAFANTVGRISSIACYISSWYIPPFSIAGAHFAFASDPHPRRRSTGGGHDSAATAMSDTISFSYNPD